MSIDWIICRVGKACHQAGQRPDQVGALLRAVPHPTPGAARRRISISATGKKTPMRKKGRMHDNFHVWGATNERKVDAGPVAGRKKIFAGISTLRSKSHDDCQTRHCGRVSHRLGPPGQPAETQDIRSAIGPRPAIRMGILAPPCESIADFRLDQLAEI
jgi:hypothetical protein